MDQQASGTGLSLTPDAGSLDTPPGAAAFSYGDLVARVGSDPAPLQRLLGLFESMATHKPESPACCATPYES